MSLLYLTKEAADAVASYGLAGRLYRSNSGWILLSVPNSIVRGAFDALQEPGVELPLKDGVLNAHCSVMRPEELESIGGADKVSERGHMFSYSFGPVKTVVPTTWSGVSRVWYITIVSPELRALRRSYGLSPQPNGDWDFHVTFAIRKTGVLGHNETSKAKAASARPERHAGPSELAWYAGPVPVGQPQAAQGLSGAGYSRLQKVAEVLKFLE